MQNEVRVVPDRTADPNSHAAAVRDSWHVPADSLHAAEGAPQC